MTLKSPVTCTVHQTGSTSLAIKVARYYHPKIGDSPHRPLQTALCTATDWPRFSHEDACWQTFFSCKRRERKPPQARYLFTFLCLPLNTTAKAPCPTRSFLLYSKSPTVSIAMGWWSSWCRAQMDSLECCSPSQKIIPEQIIQSVLAMLLLALRIYFMIGCS